jgi:hypothetical protein
VSQVLSKSERLRGAIEVTTEVLRQHGNSFGNALHQQVIDAALRRKCTIYRQFVDLVTILRMASRCMEDSLQAVEPAVWESAPGPIDRQAAMEVQDEFLIVLQVIYEWLYHLKFQIDKECEHSGVNLLPQDSVAWIRLSLHCSVRHHLVTHSPSYKFLHREKLVAYGGEGQDTSACFLAISHQREDDLTAALDALLILMFGPSSFPKDGWTVRVSWCIAACLKIFAGVYEEPSTLIQPLQAYQSKLKDFIEKFGAVSAEPVILAEDIRDLAVVVVPVLFPPGSGTQPE